MPSPLILTPKGELDEVIDTLVSEITQTNEWRRVRECAAAIRAARLVYSAHNDGAAIAQQQQYAVAQAGGIVARPDLFLGGGDLR